MALIPVIAPCERHQRFRMGPCEGGAKRRQAPSVPSPRRGIVRFGAMNRNRGAAERDRSFAHRRNWPGSWPTASMHLHVVRTEAPHDLTSASPSERAPCLPRSNSKKPLRQPNTSIGQDRRYDRPRDRGGRKVRPRQPSAHQGAACADASGHSQAGQEIARGRVGPIAGIQRGALALPPVGPPRLRPSRCLPE